MVIVRSTPWALERGAYIADQGIREILLNFMLIEELRPFFGVDVMNV